MTVTALFAALSVLLSPTALQPAPQPTFYLGGVQVHELDAGRWTETLSDVGMNTVAVTVYAKQGDWDGDSLWFNDHEPAVVAEIREARERDLAVVLILRVALQHGSDENKFLWHGQIMPQSDALIDSWFERYSLFVTKWARIAEAEGVEVLGIGSEMKALVATLPVSRAGNLLGYHGFLWYLRMQRNRARQFSGEIERRHLWVRGYDNYETLDDYLDARYEHNREWARQAYLRSESGSYDKINRRRRRILDQWIRLIEGARRVYSGKLTYAANFDNYRNVGFWPQLDLLGVNAYFSLRSGIGTELDSDRKLAVFTESWEEILDEMRTFRHEHGLGEQPVLFTEMGYTFRRHSTVEPWAHDGFSVVGWKAQRRRLVVWPEQPIDYDERTLALRALDAARRAHRFPLAGLLYWKLSTSRAHARIEPFVLHIGPDSTDPLQDVLLGFISPAVSAAD